jgi:hypothetical protein
VRDKSVSGEDASGRGAGGGRDADGDDAVWRDLVARFDMPAAHQPEAAPWPDRESLTPPARDPEAAGPVPGAERARVIRPAAPSPADAPTPSAPAGSADGSTADLPGPDLPALDGSADGLPGDGLPGDGLPGNEVAVAGADPSRARRADDGTGEHFIPPPPPPLPHLDPVAKGAWTALFGGPAYLLWATLMGWVIPGWAALLAVMAFIGGFAVVVLRLSDRPSGGAGPDDDGAVL